MSLRDYKKYGNAAEQLSLAVRNGSISHAYLLEGDYDVDKTGMAKAFVKAIFCKDAPGLGCDQCATCRKIDNGNYEDLYLLEPTKGEAVKNATSVKDEALEELQRNLKTVPSAGDRNIAIIVGADQMTQRAKARILKTLEEPAPGTVMLLLSENRNHLSLPILSRCVCFHLTNMEPESDSEMEGFSRELVEMIAGGQFFYDIVKKIDGIIDSRQEAVVFLDATETLLGRWLRRGTGQYPQKFLIEGIRATEEAKTRIDRNVSYKYAIRELILKLGNCK